MLNYIHIKYQCMENEKNYSLSVKNANFLEKRLQLFT